MPESRLVSRPHFFVILWATSLGERFVISKVAVAEIICESSSYLVFQRWIYVEALVFQCDKRDLASAKAMK
jgi:hypothetical protein